MQTTLPVWASKSLESPYNPATCLITNIQGGNNAWSWIPTGSPGYAPIGVYQALSTRNGGEVISADSY